ncbi:MAG: glycosyltransferase family 4 protein [Acidimicrobiia bacterium]|nr:glycosyltransferase family 4 protein [Acidimicrobiia bacterium]
MPVRSISEGLDDPLDVLLFTHEPLWHVLGHFRRVRRRIFYALHYSRLYGKSGSWESLRVPVDLQLANSSWTADRIQEETGHRPTVLLGGVNREVFRPRDGPKRFDILTMGRDDLPWKGHATVAAAAALAGRGLESYAGKGLSQEALGEAYDAARVFAVGSWFEGFCQPGLEALASGVPLVTTDNGGCREYAFDGETALVVEPGDVAGMARAFDAVLGDPELAGRLVTNGLDVVDRDFDWERRTDDLEEILEGVAAGRLLAPPPPRPAPPDAPDLSVIVDGRGRHIDLQALVESIRQHTDVAYELVVVGRATHPMTADYLRAAADVHVEAGGCSFAEGLDAALACSRGAHVAFCTAGSVMRPAWASRVIDALSTRPGLAVPATSDRTAVEVRPPFGVLEATSVYALPTAVARGVGGWDSARPLPSGHALDLAFRCWVRDLDVVAVPDIVGDRVRTSAQRFADAWLEPWAGGRRRVLRRWASPPAEGTEETPAGGMSPVRQVEARRAAVALDRRLRPETGPGVGWSVLPRSGRTGRTPCRPSWSAARPTTSAEAGAAGRAARAAPAPTRSARLIRLGGGSAAVAVERVQELACPVVEGV